MKFWTLIILSLALAGCGGSKKIVEPVVDYDDLHPVTGQVTFKGEPIPDGTVKFHTPKSLDDPRPSYGPSAIVKADGTFEVYTYREEGKGIGAPAGDYLITVHWVGPTEGLSESSIDELEERIPVKYRNPRTSGLKVTVNAGSNVIPPIDLQ